MEKTKQKRTTLRTLTTKLTSKIEREVVKDEIDVGELEELMEELSLKSEQLKLVDEEILSEITDVALIDEEINKSDEYMTKIIRCKTKLKRAIEKGKPTDSVRDDPLIRSTNRKSVFEAPFIKLPLLCIGKFDGQPSDFRRFMDQFESAIDKNPDLSDIEKFNYLKSYLTGAAADAIKGFSLTSQNYKASLDELKNRFGNKNLIVQAHLNNLLYITPVKRATEINKLRKLLDICQTEVRNLESIGINVENYGTLLCPILIKALPSEIVIEITKRLSSESEWNIQGILKILRNEIEGREKAEFMTRCITDSRQTNPCNSRLPPNWTDKQPLVLSRRRQEVAPTAAGLLNDSRNRKDILCLFCRAKHSLADCKMFLEKPLDEKREFLLRRGCCFVCLCPGHLKIRCRVKGIKCTICSKNHYWFLCPQQREEGDNSEDSNPDANRESFTLANKTCQQEVLMQTLTVRLLGKGKIKERHIRILYDTGSAHSYIRKNLIEEMGYEPIGEEKINHCLFGGVQQEMTHKRYKIFLSDKQKKYFCNFEVYDQEKICTDIPKIKDGPWITEAKRKGIIFSDFERKGGSLKQNEGDIDLLVGSDVYGKLLTGRRNLLSGGLAAVETSLGWTLMGKIPRISNSSDTALLTITLLSQTEKVKDLWDLEILGIRDPVETKRLEDLNKEAVEFFGSTVKVEPDGRYTVSLPWVSDHPELPTNRMIAERRLSKTVKNLKSLGKLEDYQNVFKEWVDEGIIERIPENPEEGHFLPHRAVIRENSTTKIRPVFDGSARTKNHHSLNDCLAKGPNLIQLIPTLLNKFRKGKIGICADIKKAFLQINLNEKDRDYLKFLWWENGDSSRLQVFRHCRVVFGLNASPFLLAATLAHVLQNAEEPFKETATMLKDSFYVDNLVTSVNSIEELQKVISHSKFLLASAKFELRGWEFNMHRDEKVNEGNYEMGDEFENKTVSVLGLQWNLREDTLSLMQTEDNRDKENPISKRTMLSSLSRIFDPLGFTAPVVLTAKLMMQRAWKLKIGWDSELPSEMVESFKKWEEELTILRKIKIPRKLTFLDLNDSEISMHVFCDASKLAYAACIFLRVCQNGSVSCQLVQAKARVAPLKEITIPRMELLSCVIGARLADSVKRELNVNCLDEYYWTDSQNALHWIQNDGGWATFVRNRVNEIGKLTNEENWHHVPGRLNPADLVSRGCSARFLKQSLWWEGPAWLRDPPEMWPKEDNKPDLEIINAEKRKTIITASNAINKENIFKNISSFDKILKVIAWIYRFQTNTKRETANRVRGNLTAEEIRRAELTLMKLVQKESFGGVMDERLRVLRPMQDDEGLIRIKSRILMRDDARDFRFPVVLPDDHPITEKLIRHKHEKANHAGIQTLMSIIREEYWILKARKTIRKVIHKCVKCLRFDATPVKAPIAPLPEDRVREAKVFEIVGIDLTGPVILRNNTKAWIVIFTCAIYRAVHLELISSLSTDTLLLTLRRFIARRGRPQKIFSDNGTNFIGSNKLLQKIDWNKVSNFYSVNKISWCFIPPASPWWGGWWERLIGMLKNILRKVLGKTSLNYEEMSTVLCDCETTMNSRPLTYLSENPEDLAPITPLMFLQEIREVGVPDLDVIDTSSLNKRLVYRQKVLNDLRKRFRSEYLGQLRQNYPFVRDCRNLKMGDIVLVSNDNTKRIDWLLAKVVQIFPAKDGQIRLVKVKTRNGEFLRTVKRLYPLEIHSVDQTYNIRRMIRNRTSKK